jgi:hypothetical protein
MRGEEVMRDIRSEALAPRRAKKVYNKPRLVRHGSVVDNTAAAKSIGGVDGSGTKRNVTK